MTTRYKPALDLVSQFLTSKVVSRIWERDISVWGASPGSADARSIQTRLGWLDVTSTMEPYRYELLKLGRTAAEEGIQHVYLLGMGGSSLCAEVLRSVLGMKDGSPDLFVLDTTDEQTITAAAGRMDPARTWFLVASKSGGTVEVSSMERYFWSVLASRGVAKPGDHFIAITDPGTALQKLAESKSYRGVFLNPADIGGRFSALSLFGLVPTALMGRSAEALLDAASAMAEGCRQENHTNPGLELGAFIGAACAAGRDKLTVALPPSLATLGLWIEQLIAESTGKHGKGALPVVDEPLGTPDAYGNDRAFVALASDRDHVDEDRLQAIEDAGHPVLRIEHTAGRHRRRILPLGVRDGGRGSCTRHQPVRRAERVGSEGEDQGTAGELRGGGAPAGRDAGRLVGQRRGVHLFLRRSHSRRRCRQRPAIPAGRRLRRVPLVPAREPRR